MARECDRYGLNLERVAAAQSGEDPLAVETSVRRWWDIAIVAAAVGIFVWLARGTQRPPMTMDAWMASPKFPKSRA